MGPSEREAETVAEGPGRRNRGGPDERLEGKVERGTAASSGDRWVDGIVDAQLRVPPPFLQRPHPAHITSPPASGPKTGWESDCPMFPCGM